MRATIVQHTRIEHTPHEGHRAGTRPASTPDSFGAAPPAPTRYGQPRCVMGQERTGHQPGSTRPRLLFLCQTLPYPPDGGVWIRSFHVLRLLARSFDVTALCFERSGTAGRQSPEQRRASLEALGAFGSVEAVPVPQTLSRIRYFWDHLRSALSGRVYTRFLYSSTTFRRHLASLIQTTRFDLVHMDSMDLSAYLPDLRDLPIVCVHHDVESRLLARRAAVEANPLRRLYLAHQAQLMEREEHLWCSRVTLNVVTSPTDAAILTQVAPGCSIGVVPNGVDVDEFRPAPRLNDRIAFVGGTTWFPNFDALNHFCENILPRLRAARRSLPPIQWVGFATQEQQRYYRERFDVELTGYVPDVRPYLRDTICSIVPLRVGGGTRIKILNAWAAGNAIVSTSVGCEGLDARDGDNILVADDPDAFARAVLRVLDDASLRNALSARGRATVERQYSWDVIGTQMTQLYLQVTRSAHR